MDIKGIKTQAELYCLFKKILAENPSFAEITYSKVELEYRVKPSRRRADLVLFFREQSKEEKPFLAIETKRSKLKKNQTSNDWDKVIFVPDARGHLVKSTVREYIGEIYESDHGYEYFKAALQQARGYAEGLSAPFFAVCYPEMLFVKSFVKGLHLYYPSVYFKEEFGSKLLEDLAKLYKRSKDAQYKE
jgi:hypothetical protein